LPTDDNGGESEDVFQDFIAALRMLEGLPVWVVIRLCTNEKKVTEFYNQIDEVLEFNLEVLDDFSKCLAFERDHPALGCSPP